MRLIWGISHGLQSISKRMEAELGITGPQRLVVRIVGRHPGLAAGQVARILHLHPSTLTGVLRRLEQRRVLERRAGERDRRQARLHLTGMGRWIDRRRAGTVESAVRQVLAGLSPAYVEAAAEALQALDAALRQMSVRGAGSEGPHGRLGPGGGRQARVTTRGRASKGRP